MKGKLIRVRHFQAAAQSIRLSENLKKLVNVQKKEVLLHML